MKQVLRLPVYRRLLAAYALNELAWSVGTLALSVLVYRRTGSALGSAVFFLTSMVLPAFAAPFVVARVDQRAPGRLLPVLYAVEGVLFAALAVMTMHFSLIPVLVLTLLDGIVAIVARALARTATTNVLKPLDLLHEGNAIINGAFSICFMAGPAIGGLVVVAGGTVAALLANCGLFVAIALILVTTSGLPDDVPEPEPAKGRLRAALEHVRRDRAQRWLLFLQAGGTIAFTISIPVEVVFAQETLHAGAGGYGALLSSWGAGAVIGSTVYARWRRRPARLLLAASGAALGLGFAVMAAAPTIVVAVLGTAGGGVGNGVWSIASQTALQEYTTTRWMALVMGLSQSVMQAAPGIGILLGGLITELSDPRAAFAVGAVGSVVFALTAWIVLRPSVMPKPPVEPDDVRPPAGPEEFVPPATHSRETLV
jgi:predicted MFS family arabinose efflux permease